MAKAAAAPGGAVWIVLALLLADSARAGGLAELAPDTLSAELRYTTAFETEDGRQSLSRLTLAPTAKWRFGRHWRAETSLRLEWADDDTGLGSTAGYSDLSKPWLANRRARVELDRAHLTWRRGNQRLSLGKQVTPWGVLDGVRITDRFDAVRRRDFVYTDVRPERIARWGVQARTQLGGWRMELSGALDPTVSQQPNLGDALTPQTPRLTGGIDLTALAGITTLELRTSSRNGYGRDLTLGARLARDLGTGQVSLLAFRGPATDPVFAWADDQPGTTVELQHPDRTLVGATMDYTLGSTVLRAELAYIPDQQVNLRSGLALDQRERARWLAGVGLDLNAPLGIFVNAQLALDYLQQGALELARPQKDLIATLRAQRSFPQAGWRLQAEWLGSLTDGDGVIRPQISRDLNDTLSLSVGGDFAFGDPQGLFGQFEPRNRAWLRLQLNL